jgi:hypothetical protein
MPFGQPVEEVEWNFAEDVTQIEVRLDDRLDVATANFAAIPFVALRHGPPHAVSCYATGALSEMGSREMA